MIMKEKNGFTNKFKKIKVHSPWDTINNEQSLNMPLTMIIKSDVKFPHILISKVSYIFINKGRFRIYGLGAGGF